MRGLSPVQAAQALADEVLFPTASQTDTADRVPRSNLDRLADAGLYGLAGPANAGGLQATEPELLGIIEALAGGCLTTAFVWLHHNSAVRAVAASASPDVRDRWLVPLCRGDKRAGFTVGGILSSGPGVRARPVDGGWRLDGVVPWVTGWGLVDVIQTAARSRDGEIIWTLVDAVESSSMTFRRIDLAVLHASVTGTVHFDDHFVPAERATGSDPLAAWGDRPAPSAGASGDPPSPGLPGPPPPLGRLDPARPPSPSRPAPGRHYQATQAGALALGVAGRCCQLLGPGPLDAELAGCRERLVGGALNDPEAIPEARAAASHLAIRAASALVVATGSRSIRLDEHPQRLLREAMFLLVFGSRPPIPAELTKLFVNRGSVASP